MSAARLTNQLAGPIHYAIAAIKVEIKDLEHCIVEDGGTLS